MLISQLNFRYIPPQKATNKELVPHLPTAKNLAKPCRFKGNFQLEHPVQHIWQGYTNGCGTTSLAMALNFLAGISGKDHRTITQEQLDQKRPFDTYCAPETLIKLAKEHGYYAQQCNQSNFQTIKSHLDKGHLIIALHNAIDGSGKQGPLHYVLVHGYQDSPEPLNQKLYIIDPGREEKNKAKFNLTYQDFCRYWDRPKLGCLPIGINRFMIVVSAQDDLNNKTYKQLPITIRIANSFHNLVNWYTNSWVKSIVFAIYKFLTFPLKILK